MEIKQEEIQGVLHAMKSGLYDFTEGGKCSDCGSCCSALLSVTRKEIKLMKRYVKAHRIRAEENGDGSSCPFRNEKERQCMIYPVRPQICRSFRCDRLAENPEAGKGDFSTDAEYLHVNMREVFK